MKNSSLKRKFVRHIRNNPMLVLGTMFLSVFLSAVMLAGIFLPHTTKSQSLTTKNLGVFGGESNEANLPPIRTSYADIVDKVSPAVVTVRSEIKSKATAQNSPLNDPMFQQFFGGRLPQMQQKPQKQNALGSGVIINNDGTILTNNHVVEGATKISVDLVDKRSFTAKVVGTDVASDLAVLKIEAKDLPVLSLGDSDKVRVGDVVLALGNPLGLQQTVTSGIISAKGRSTGLSDGSYEDFLQTDAPINHGNSGGALVNLNGELIGINSQILSPSGGSIGIGFAIPSNMAKGVSEQLTKDGKVHRGQLGIGIQNVTSELANNFGLKDIRGVVVTQVSPDSPADKAGIKQGDVILKVNDTNITDGNELRNKIAQTQPNSEVTIELWRDNKEQSVKATLTEFKASKTAQNDEDSNDESGESDSKAAPQTGKFGLALQQLTPQTAQQLGLKNNTSGLVVANVDDGSPSDEAGIAQGDVILSINRQPVKTVAEAKAALDKTDGSVLFLINRRGQTLFVTVQN